MSCLVNTESKDQIFFIIFCSTECPNESEYDVSDNDAPEFVPRGCDSSSCDDEGVPSGNKGVRSSMRVGPVEIKGLDLV